MKPKHRNRRLASIALGGVALAAGVALLATALNDNRSFFYPPSAIAEAGFVAGSDTVRIGGIVVVGTLEKGEGLRSTFHLRDFEGDADSTLRVSHTGILPNLFKEDSGAVVTGRLVDGRLVAHEVLAKHDENYVPKLD